MFSYQRLNHIKSIRARSLLMLRSDISGYNNRNKRAWLVEPLKSLTVNAENRLIDIDSSFDAFFSIVHDATDSLIPKNGFNSQLNLTGRVRWKKHIKKNAWCGGYGFQKEGPAACKLAVIKLYKSAMYNLRNIQLTASE